MSDGLARWVPANAVKNTSPDGGCSLILDFPNWDGSTKQCRAQYHNTQRINAGGYFNENGSLFHTTLTGPYDSIDIRFSSGNLAAGTSVRWMALR